MFFIHRGGGWSSTSGEDVDTSLRRAGGVTFDQDFDTSGMTSSRINPFFFLFFEQRDKKEKNIMAPSVGHVIIATNVTS